MSKRKRAFRAQLQTISGSLKHKADAGILLFSHGKNSFVCGAFTAAKTEAGYTVWSDRSTDAVCEGLQLVESAILVAHHMQRNDIMTSNYIISVDALITRHLRAMEIHSHSVKMAVKSGDFERKDIMYARYLFAKDRVTFYRRKIKSKSNGIVKKR